MAYNVKSEQVCYFSTHHMINERHTSRCYQKFLLLAFFIPFVLPLFLTTPSHLRFQILKNQTICNMLYFHDQQLDVYDKNISMHKNSKTNNTIINNMYTNIPTNRNITTLHDLT